MRRSLLLAVCAASLGFWGCSFGDRSVRLRYDRPQGDPQVFRGISLILEEPVDLRPEPHDVVGSVRSAVGTKTAEITTNDDVRRWIHRALTAELQHAGFLVSFADKPGRALRVRTMIRSLEAREGIGFGARMTLELRVEGDEILLLQKTYAAEDRHVLVTETSGDEAGDSLRSCLKKIGSQIVQDLVTIVETAPD